MRMPTLFLPHGGGPCFFLNADGSCPPMWISMRDHLASVLPSLSEQPRAVLIVSAHWEEEAATVHVGERPSLLYDYYGFPPHTYHLDYAPPAATDVARQAGGLLKAAGFAVGEERDRGWDHGVFVPMMVLDEGHEIPVAQISLIAGLDPAAHVRMGQALEPLRDEGVLIIGSGMSFHNMRPTPGNEPKAIAFDAALADAVSDSDPAQRAARVADWAALPEARFSHPREEHLIPLMVAVGAGGGDPGQLMFRDSMMGWPISAFRFG